MRAGLSRTVSTPVINNPILNTPFAEPSRHWVLDESGIPTGFPADGRRRSEFVVPVPPPKHKVKAQGTLELEDEYGQRKSNDYINEIRAKVTAWRALGDTGLRSTVTPITARLLQHWRDPTRSRRLFFCQIEAAETAIWLAEVAPKAELDRLRILNTEANPDLFRIAFKLATGAGKTTVMAMLIAWQTLNAARAPSFDTLHRCLPDHRPRHYRARPIARAAAIRPDQHLRPARRHTPRDA